MTNILYHGGLTAPVCHTLYPCKMDACLAEAKTLKQVPVSDADLSTVYRFGDGALTPLAGPMNQETWNRVLNEEVIIHDGKKYAWTIPLAFPLTEELAKSITPGEKVALVNSAGEIVAVVTVSDVYPWDKMDYLKKVYLTERTDHPGADMVLVNDAGKDWLLGGTIAVFPQPRNPSFGKYVLAPDDVRCLLDTKGWERVVAFQTRNPLHRAHEYALVYGLEVLIRQGLNAGACLNPLVGETKGDDVCAEVRMETYEKLIENRLLGEGDSDASLWGPREMRR